MHSLSLSSALISHWAYSSACFVLPSTSWYLSRNLAGSVVSQWWYSPFFRWLMHKTHWQIGWKIKFPSCMSSVFLFISPSPQSVMLFSSCVWLRCYGVWSITQSPSTAAVHFLRWTSIEFQWFMSSGSDVQPELNWVTSWTCSYFPSARFSTTTGFYPYSRWPFAGIRFPYADPAVNFSSVRFPSSNQI